MEILNKMDFINVNKKFNLQKLSSNEIIIINVDEIYDGPLSGICKWNEEEYYFYSFDQLHNDGSGDRFPSKYILIKLNQSQSLDFANQTELYEKWKQGELNDDEYSAGIKKLPEWFVNTDQIIGWFDSTDEEPKSGRFIESYFEWKERNTETGNKKSVIKKEDNEISHHKV